MKEVHEQFFHKQSDINSSQYVPFFAIIFYVFASSFLYHILFISNLIFLLVFLISAYLVFRYKFYKKLYYYVSAVIMLLMIFLTPEIFHWKSKELLPIDYPAWFMYFCYAILGTYFYVTEYLLPILGTKCSKQLFILPFAVLFFFQIALLIMDFAIIALLLYYNYDTTPLIGFDLRAFHIF